MRTRNSQSLDALFVGYEDQENLGLRSIMAVLHERGFRTALQPYTPGDPSGVLTAVCTHSPRLVGFSIIFQYTLDEFANLTAALREAGVRAHFTVGGHFPSLRPREVLDALPCVDSVVRFEGELTTVELLRRLRRPGAWSSIEGLAFRHGSNVIINPPRPLIADLDTLPPLVRGQPRLLPRGIRVSSLLASRGCVYDCSFCSIRQFYGGAPGPLRRVRAPEAVVAEMQELFERDGVRFFIFQDDDFAANTQRQREWVAAFLDTLDQAHLTGQVGWKISCRVNDVDQDLICRCRERGLVAVYLGVESGSLTGLRTLNKHVTVEQNLEAIETLKRAGVAFDMGFMLFDPSSTLETIRENIDFLRQVTSDGACPANFCKMLPYAGTPIEAQLQNEGRLKGTVSQPDYDFLDSRLDWYALFVARVFRFRNFDRLGLVERLRLARFDQVLAQTFKAMPHAGQYEKALCALTARANAVALDTLEAGLGFVADRDVDSLATDWPLLSHLANQEWEAEIEIQRELDQVLATYNLDLLRAFAHEFSRRFARQQTSSEPFNAFSQIA
jgi:radical SAM superfamily enzyme YgiQ (UPF0313 family)